MMQMEKTFTVRDQDTAHAVGNEGVHVLGTPILITFMEGVCHEAMVPSLASGEGTVGTAVNIKHLKATPVGGTVRIIARRVGGEGRRHLFAVEGYDDKGQVLSGEHERAIVDLDRFLEKIRAG